MRGARRGGRVGGRGGRAGAGVGGMRWCRLGTRGRLIGAGATARGGQIAEARQDAIRVGVTFLRAVFGDKDK